MGSQANTAHFNEQTIEAHAERPWLDRRGFALNVQNLRIESQSWDETTWERYLAWYETSLKEQQIHPGDYDRTAERMEESIFEFAQSNADDELKARVNQLLASLTPRQRKIIDLIFWQGWSERRVAFELNLNQKSVYRLKKRALNKISKLLKGGLTFPLMRGEIPPPSSITGEANGKEVLELAERKIPKAG